MRILSLVLMLIILFGSMIAVAYPQENQADTTETLIDEPLRSPKAAMWRSLIVPGWGQHYNGQNRKAWILAGMQAGCVAGAIIADHYAYQNLDRSKEFKDTSYEALYRDRYETYSDWNSFFKWWYALLALYSMGDAYVEAHLAGFEEQVQDDSVWDVTLQPATESLKFGLKYNF